MSGMSGVVYAVVFGTGRAETIKDGSDYWSVLDIIYREYQSAGGNWNRPVMLLANGKVVVERGLADLAWSYGTALLLRKQQAVAAVRAEQFPDWLSAVETPA